MILQGPFTRHLFFTGKGGVGKTSVATATAVALADEGRRVLLVSTDPASNLDEVLGASLGSKPTPVPGVPGLAAMNLDPEEAARAYRERMLAPYRGVLPEVALRSMEEQFSGACTVEIAAFDEFAALLGDPAATAEFDHVIFDTAPTGHTLRLLRLPAAWSGFLAENAGGGSCLGPLAGLAAKRSLYESALAALGDASATTVVLVARPESASLHEADRTCRELAELGVADMRLVVNGRFTARDPSDPIAAAFEARDREALADLPEGLAKLPRSDVSLRPIAPVGVAALRALAAPEGEDAEPAARDTDETPEPTPPPLESLIPELGRPGRGVILVMGKGGVGKTTVAARLALAIAREGRRVHLVSTDPAARRDGTVEETWPNLSVERIDPEEETAAYAAEVLAEAGEGLDAEGLALLREDLRSPCTEEVAVFRAFARTVDRARDAFVVLDTAPTGHTLLLLDAAEAYHREVGRNRGAAPEAVRELLPRLRDPDFARVVLVTLPEPTPVHEADALRRDLKRAGIEPFAAVVNQSLAPLAPTDPLLRARRSRERPYIREACERLAPRTVLIPWGLDPTPFCAGEPPEGR